MPTNEQHNTVFGTGNIATGGTFNNSPMTSTTINSGAGAGSQAFWVGRLADELTRAQNCLAGGDPPVTAKVGNAVVAIAGLQAEIAAFREDLAAGPPPPEKRKRLRDRVQAVLAVLLPVAEMIGGVAGIEDILHHL